MCLSINDFLLPRLSGSCGGRAFGNTANAFFPQRIVWGLALLWVVNFRQTAEASVNPPSATPAAKSSASPSAPVEQPRFFVKRYHVEGGSGILSRGEIEEAVYPYLGPGRDFSDVSNACDALAKAYQAKGYQTVAVVPEAPTQPGVIVLQVTEEKIGRLRVNGSRYYLPSEIRREAPSLTEGSFPNINDVTHDIVGLNQQPDRQVTPAISASQTPGMVDVDLNVKDSPPLHGSVELNNRYSQGTTPLRVDANVSYDNLFQMGHSISLSYQVAPEKPADAEVFSGSYLARIPNVSWLSFMVYGLESNSDVATVGGINVIGKGDVVGLRMIMDLPTLRETGFYHSISLGLDYKDFDQNIDLGGGVAENTPVTYYPFSVTYSGTAQDKNSTTQFNAGITFGVDGMGSSQAAFDAKGFGTSANYFYFHGNIARTQELPLGMEGYGNFQYQIADQPLLNTEQISAGGLDTVRGYLESETLGDNGMIGQFEMRTPSLGKWLGPTVGEWRFYVFGDAAWLAINHPLPEVTTQFDLASCGVGTRIKLLDYLSGSFDAAFPLLAGPDTPAYSPRLTFQLTAAY